MVFMCLTTVYGYIWSHRAILNVFKDVSQHMSEEEAAASSSSDEAMVRGGSGHVSGSLHHHHPAVLSGVDSGRS